MSRSYNSRWRPGAKHSVIPPGPQSTVAPSWRDQQRERLVKKRQEAINGARQEIEENALKVKLQPVPGSSIMVEGLPFDTTPYELEELFVQTVGYVVDSYLLYNDKGYPKGKGYVQFSHPTDAALARKKYHGRVIDGRSPIHVRLIVDADEPLEGRTGLIRINQSSALASRVQSEPTGNVGPLPPSPPPLPLFKRLGPPVAPLPKHIREGTRSNPVPTLPPQTITAPISRTNQPLRSRTKKGPKRTAKRAQRLAMARVPSKGAAELDADLDNYMSVAPTGLLNP